MSVLIFERTGHVLGATTRNTRAETPVTVADVAHDGFWLRDDRGDGLRSLIDATALGVSQVPLDVRPMYRPQHFSVIDGRAEEQTLAPPTVVLDGSAIAITLPSAATSALQVFVHITGGSLATPIMRGIDVADGSAVGSEALTLSAGNYLVAVFTPGHQASLTLESVA